MCVKGPFVARPWSSVHPAVATLPAMVADAPANEPVRQYRFTAPPGACDLLLVRHGESMPIAEGQEIPTIEGQADPPLDPQGHEEARRVGERLAGEEISAIYTSSLTRTKQTAAPLAERLGLVPIEESDLREVFLGEWEGIYRIRIREGSEIAQRFFAEQEWGVIPGAETNAQFADRVRRGIMRIAAAHPDQRVVAFVHGGVIGAAMQMAAQSRSMAFVGAENGSINHLVILDENRWVLRRFNDTGHLATDLDRPIQPVT